MIRKVLASSQFVEQAAAVIVEALAQRLEHQSEVSLALSGGRTPWPVFRRLAEAAIDWPRVHVYQVDERIAPAGDRARNLTGLQETLLERVPAVVHPMPVEADDLQEAAAAYAGQLPPALDLVHLGLGDDGHTASLVPGDPILTVRDRRVALTQSYRGHRRMTLTYPSLDAAEMLLWLVSGDEKIEMARRLYEGDRSIPAGRVAQERAVLVIEEE
jgi:6-phosphogluconolactonase